MPQVQRPCIALVTGGHKFILNFEATQAGVAGALQQLGRWASNKDLPFSWFDAAMLAQKVRRFLP